MAHLDFEDNSIDAIYIDGNHSYEAVIEDIKNWSPKVKQGGLIIGDDYLTFEVEPRATPISTRFKSLLLFKFCSIILENADGSQVDFLSSSTKYSLYSE